MVLLERREFDVGIWRMAIELSIGFISLRLYESAFLVAMFEEYYFLLFFIVSLEALRDEYFVIMSFVYIDWDFL